MIDYAPLLDWLAEDARFRDWGRGLQRQIDQGLSPARWGDLPRWREVLDHLPSITPSTLEFGNRVAIGGPEDCDDHARSCLRETLMGLHPWRKGPVQLFGLDIDTEWRSDWKWDRLRPHVAPLAGRTVLDVGCGNGYHCLRMLGAGAARVIGIDPSARFVFQFHALKRYFSHLPVDVLPLAMEQMPPVLHSFDSVFSMGVLYHRKEPEAHLAELHGCLKPGGQLLLETLVLDRDDDTVLVPEKRYAKMRNVWAVPAPTRVLDWLERCGFQEPRQVNLCPTSLAEQRRTDWMRFESLADFLDPANPELTVEGHPGPVRAMFVAETPPQH